MLASLPEFFEKFVVSESTGIKSIVSESEGHLLNFGGILVGISMPVSRSLPVTEILIEETPVPIDTPMEEERNLQTNNETTTCVMEETSDTEMKQDVTTSKKAIDVVKAPKLLKAAQEIPGTSAPKESFLARDRASKRARRDSSSNVKVSAAERAAQHKGEGLYVSNNLLFCKFCRKPVGTKQSVITKHLQTALHANNRKAHAAEHKKQSDVYLLVQAQAQTEDSKASRDFSTESRRYQVVEAFMGAGIPLSKIAAYLPLRRVLEVGNQRLASTTTLTEHIPLILKAEKSRIRDELRVGVPVAARINTTIPCSVFFDGATKVCECMAFICRFTFEGWPQQRVVALKLLEKSVKASELAQVFNKVMTQEYALEADKILAIGNDRASVNLAAFNLLQPFFPNALDVGCFSHTINNAGKEHQTPKLKEFLSVHNQIISRSAAARLIFRDHVKESPRRSSMTRWFAEWEICEQLFNNWPSIRSYLKSCQEGDVCPALSLQGLTLFDSCMELYIELAATIDGLGPFVRACHVLEGDGFLAPLVYDKLLELREHTEVAGFPNVKALSRSRHPHDAGAQHTLVSHGKSCVQPCFRLLLQISSHCQPTPLQRSLSRI